MSTKLTKFKVGDTVIHVDCNFKYYVGVVTAVYRKDEVYLHHYAVEVSWTNIQTSDRSLPLIHIPSNLRIIDEEEHALCILGAL